MKYDNFFFPADDLATSCRFYQDVLDLPVKFDFSENGMVAFRVASRSLNPCQPRAWLRHTPYLRATQTLRLKCRVCAVRTHAVFVATE